MKSNQMQEKTWIIQRCINAFKNEYENWPGYCENPMTFDEMKKALKECDEKWGVSHDYEFRGHNIRQSNKVPINIEGVDIDITAQDIVSCIHESRKT